MIRFHSGNALTLLENGLQYFPAIEAAFDRAQREIYLQTYIFEDDATGRAVAAALCRAARRGVSVRLMVDGFGGRASFISRLMPQLCACGVQVLIFRRELSMLSLDRHRLRRLHRKVVVIDARVAFVGGINVVDDFDGGALAFPRYDYAVRIEGPLLGPIVDSVQRLWRLVSWVSMRRRSRTSSPFPPELAPSGDMCAAFVVRDNLRYRHAIEEAYLDAFQRAEREIFIANAYFFPGWRFRHALIEAATRGVEVTLLLQGMADHPVQRYATRALYPFFLEHGVRLFEYHRSQLHAKVAVVDGSWATVGSSNIDPFSLLLAREANVMVRNEAFAQQLRASMLRARDEGGRELKIADWKRLSLADRGLNWIAYQVVRTAIGIAGYGDKHGAAR